MRNRAKCALCADTIEVFVQNEYVSCRCGEITIGPDLYARATDFKNFLRVDADGNEKAVTYQQENSKQDSAVDDHEPIDNTHNDNKPSKDEMLAMLDEMVTRYASLPQHAQLAPVTHADHASLLMLVSSLFKSL